LFLSCVYVPVSGVLFSVGVCVTCDLLVCVLLRARVTSRFYGYRVWRECLVTPFKSDGADLG